MGATTIPTAGPKTRYVVTLTSGTSWTVPTGVNYINATLYGAGGGSGGASTTFGKDGLTGQIISTNLTTTPGASITYAIGAGGTAGATSGGTGGTGGTTTFTGATSALGGAGGLGGLNNAGIAGTANTGLGAQGANAPLVSPATSTQGGAAGGSGKIEIEYWV